MESFLKAALEEEKLGLAGAASPSVRCWFTREKIIGHGHNQRVQKSSVIHHAEKNCLENAGRLTAAVYQKCTLYFTLSPCPICSGAILLYKIPRVVIGENVTFKGPKEHVRAQGVSVEVLQHAECIKLKCKFIAPPARNYGMRTSACNSAAETSL